MISYLDIDIIIKNCYTAFMNYRLKSAYLDAAAQTLLEQKAERWLSMEDCFDYFRTTIRHSPRKNYQEDDSILVSFFDVISGETAEEKDALGAYNALPTSFKKLIQWSRLELWIGKDINAIDHKIIDAVKAEVKEYDDVSGLYISSLMNKYKHPAIFIPIEINGQKIAGSGSIFKYELGHHIDILLGTISNTKEFFDAVQKDLADLIDIPESSLLQRTRIYNLMKNYFSHFLPTPLGDQPDMRSATSELFAELFSDAIAPDESRMDLYEAFPESFKVVKKILDQLIEETALLQKPEFSAPVSPAVA